MPENTFPYVPQEITVHLGPPDADAENVTVSFPDYVKNVASSEIYPTWEPAAIRANIIAIVSFALNRIFTEFYPSRGYDFDITASTAYDQKFIKDRNIFENISQAVDETFNTYIRRKGFIEPLAAKFCNGTTSTCEGLSQWGSQELAQQGMDSVDILRHYYGDDIELVVNAPIRGIQYSYPGFPLRRGMSGPNVFRLQFILGRIAQSYPALPVLQLNSTYDEATEEAVRMFQDIFGLTVDGVTGKGTWNKAILLYTGLNKLSELASLGQPPRGPLPPIQHIALREGMEGVGVEVIQTMLSVVSQFYNSVPGVTVDGRFGPETTDSVRALQRLAGLPQDGVVGDLTWEALYRAYAGIADTMEEYTNVVPPQHRPELSADPPPWLTLG